MLMDLASVPWVVWVVLATIILGLGIALGPVPRVQGHAARGAAHRGCRAPPAPQGARRRAPQRALRKGRGGTEVPSG